MPTEAPLHPSVYHRARFAGIIKVAHDSSDVKGDMMRAFSRGAVGLAIILLAGGASSASDSGPRAFDSRWLRDLRSDDFRVREEASLRIASSGPAAIAPLKQAAGEMDREAAARCVGVLERLSRSTESETARLATDALNELEKSSNPVVSELAAAAIVKSEKLPSPSLPRLGVQPIRRVNFQIQLQGGMGGRRTTIRTINGQRTVTIEENGTTTVIEDANGKDIRVTVTEAGNGVPKVTEYSGTDLDDLRKRSPAGATIYENATRGQAVPADLEKRRAEMQLRAEKIREASLLQMEITKQLHVLRRDGRAGTPEYSQLEQQLKDSREALRNVARP